MARPPRGWQLTEQPDPDKPRRPGLHERREQAAARAAGHLARYFDGRPNPDELRKALPERLGRSWAASLAAIGAHGPGHEP